VVPRLGNAKPTSAAGHRIVAVDELVVSGCGALLTAIHTGVIIAVPSLRPGDDRPLSCLGVGRIGD
jgi:hypothetical protein